MLTNRRQILRAGLGTAAAAAAARFTVAASPDPAGGMYRKTFRSLDRFVEQYMRDMGSPGMTLVLADRAGVQRVATYGLGDLERRKPARPEELFQIGSISKSFVAICLLQLRDEGKLDLHRPVYDYLPWFRVESTFAPITVHHLLTHGSGLPGNAAVFLSDVSQGHRAAYPPGAHFYYSNLAYSLLGHLAWTLDGRPLPELLRRRILEPLGMSHTEPAITPDMRDRLVKSYSAFQDDRPASAGARLCEAPAILLTEGAGCIASPAADMGAYVRMIANRGVGPNGPLLSRESFELFSQRHLDAADFGPGASYGYGIAVDELDGNVLLRHTGGMISFMSAMMVDIDAGVGAFASINAMQGYRPNPVARFAIQLMRAQQDGRPLPQSPPSDPPTRITNSSDYEGAYEGAVDRVLIEREGERLFVVRGSERALLERAGEPDRFTVAPVNRAPFRFPLQFLRRDPGDPKSAVTEAMWGSDWYAGAAYEGPRQFDHPPQWERYVGHYRSENPWVGSIRIVSCKGRLWINGTIPLQPAGDRFLLRDEPHSPEWLAFSDVVNGRCMRVRLSGEDLRRVDAA